MKIKISGFGGQGVLLLGDILIHTASKEGKNITWMPSYGPEARSGTCVCQVIVSDKEIGSPIVDEPDILIVMNLPSMDRFEPGVKKNGFLIYNSSLIHRKTLRNDIKYLGIPATEIAEEIGNTKIANMVLLGVYLACSDCISKDTVFNKTFPEKFSGGKEKFIPLNKIAVKKGIKYCKEIGSCSSKKN